MPDQTPVTDDDRKAHKWASHYGGGPLDPVARAIRAHVPAPPKSLAEQIRGWDTAPRSRGDLRVLADRVEAVEEERDEARAEVKRLKETAERLNAAHEGSTSRDLPDPADVPEGEPWLVQVGDEEPAAGIKTILNRWRVYHPLHGTRTAGPHDVTLAARLVPDTRRVIDRPEDLDKLPAGSVILDNDADSWTRHDDALWYCFQGVAADCEALIDTYGPVTVIHEPEVTA